MRMGPSAVRLCLRQVSPGIWNVLARVLTSGSKFRLLRGCCHASRRPTSAVQKTETPLEPSWLPDACFLVLTKIVFLPSLKEIVARFHEDGLIDSDHHVAFFTGLQKDMQGTGELIAGWFASRSTDEAPLQYCWCSTCTDQIWFAKQHMWIDKNVLDHTAPDEWGQDPLEDFLGCYFQAMSVAVVNPDVYVFTPRGYRWVEASAWVQYGECIHPALASRTNHRHTLPVSVQTANRFRILGFDQEPERPSHLASRSHRCKGKNGSQRR